MKEDTPLEDLFGAEALDAARDVRPPASLRPRLMAAAAGSLAARRPRRWQLAAAALLGFAGFGLLGAAVDRGGDPRSVRGRAPGVRDAQGYRASSSAASAVRPEERRKPA